MGKHSRSPKRHHDRDHRRNYDGDRKDARSLQRDIESVKKQMKNKLNSAVEDIKRAEQLSQAESSRVDKGDFTNQFETECIKFGFLIWIDKKSTNLF